MSAAAPNASAAPGAPQIPCTQCGGPLPVADDDPFVVCTHCRAALFLDLGRYVLHGEVRPRLSRADATAALNRHLQHVEAELPESIDSVSTELRPWYVVPARGGAVAVAAFADEDGADPAPAGQAAVSGEVVPYSGGEVRTVAPTLRAADAVARVEDGRPEGVRLVHVPVHVVRWRHRRESYRALVDAVLGSVASPRLPPPAGAGLGARALLVISFATAACAVEAALLPGILLPLLANGVTAALVMVAGKRSEIAS